MRFHRSISSGGDGEVLLLHPFGGAGRSSAAAACFPLVLLASSSGVTLWVLIPIPVLAALETTRKWLNRPAHAAAFVRCRSGEARWGTTRQKQLCCSAL